MTTGQKLKRWREGKGLNQRAAAKGAGISQAMWQAIEKDSCPRIGLDVARSVVAFTDGAITLDDLGSKRPRSRPSSPPPRRRAA